MDWNALYWPNKCCHYYGNPLQLGKLVKNGSTHGQLHSLCSDFGNSLPLSYATAYYEPAIFQVAVGALAEKNAIRATDHILQIDKDNV